MLFALPTLYFIYKNLYHLLLMARVARKKHFIFLFTYQYFREARVFYYTRQGKLASDERSNLLDPLVIRPQSLTF